MDVTAMIKIDDEKEKKDLEFKPEDKIIEKEVDYSLSYSQSC